MIIENTSNRALMSLSAYSTRGRRNHMEDFFDIGYQMKPQDQQRPNEWPYEYFYLGIFDGHGGHEAAQFAKRKLLHFITKQPDFWSKDDDCVMRSIRQGFAECHEAMKLQSPNWSKTSKILPSTAGCTASILFIRNGKFYTGHVGDSRIVISKEHEETHQWIAEQITEDHKPESPKETARINRAGGEVRSKIGVHRVVWRRPVFNRETGRVIEMGPGSHAYEEFLEQVYRYPVPEEFVASYQSIAFLSIARSLGDFWSINPHSGQYVVSPEPDVSCRPIEANDKCILLATDGLWNVINSGLSSRMMYELAITRGGTRALHREEYFLTDNYYDVEEEGRDNHARSMVCMALQNWERKSLKSDNITVVCALLYDILDSFNRYDTRTRSVKKQRPSINGSKPVQIGQTYNYAEIIRINESPLFNYPCGETRDKLMYKFENLLLMPPTIFERDTDFKPLKIIYPKNYMKLSVVPYRKMKDEESYLPDSYVYIKNVTDDPADMIPQPTRADKNGKEVRDSSAQATQSIHDFGQPWDQLLVYDPRIYDSDLAFRDDIRPPCDQLQEDWLACEDEEPVFENKLTDEEKLQLDRERAFQRDNLERQKAQALDELEQMKSIELSRKSIVENNTEKRDRASPPRLRDLVNRSSPERRLTRRSYVSLSENAKRRVPDNCSSSMQKAKRRKTQPIRSVIST